MSPLDLSRLADLALGAPKWCGRGRVVNVVGELIEAELPGAEVGGLCDVAGRPAEVVGFRGSRALLVLLGSSSGIALGSPVRTMDSHLRIRVSDELTGRVIDALGHPLDGGPPIAGRPRAVDAPAPAPMRRLPIDEPLLTGVRAIDGLCTLGRGQRISIAAGSGVGKSTLLAMLARGVSADVIVVCLVGERGREVREFIEHTLGPEGLARSVVVVATSDRPPALQIASVRTATAVAEAFRDQGKDVLLLVDSLTRLAHARRQVGLAAGEPPTTRGYPPSVFSLLPRLLERAGRVEGGSITGIYTVLVDGDAHDDPIADAVRGLVDGHVVLSRRYADRGHFPAVDPLASLSRLMRRVADTEHVDAATEARRLLAVYQDNEELVRLGAYRPGTVPEVDRALQRAPRILELLRQAPDDVSALEGTVAAMRDLTSA